MKNKKTINIQPSRLRGFTLVEILIATAILAIIVGMFAYVFRIATESWSKSEARLARYQNARAALEMMSREISTAVLMAHSVYHIDLVHIPPDPRFLFVAPVDPEVSTARFDLVGLGYRYNSTTRTIDRGIQTTHPGVNWPLPGTWSPVADYIESLSFRFYDILGGVTLVGVIPPVRLDWDSRTAAEGGTILGTLGTENRLPRAVRITITVRDPLHIEPAQTFSTMVYIGAAE